MVVLGVVDGVGGDAHGLEVAMELTVLSQQHNCNGKNVINTL